MAPRRAFAWAVWTLVNVGRERPCQVAISTISVWRTDMLCNAFSHFNTAIEIKMVGKAFAFHKHMAAVTILQSQLQSQRS